MSHSPLPWRLIHWSNHKNKSRGFAGHIVASDNTEIYHGPFSFWSLNGEENAQLIVTAVNSHFDLLEALEELYVAANPHTNMSDIPLRDALSRAKSAIAKAKGEK